jgi:hypothetical protein
MTSRFFVAGAAAALALVLPLNARAVAVHGVANDVPFVIGYHPLHSSQSPYLGQLYLNFNNGVVSGTYTDLSIKPGSPLANAQKVPVSGGVSGSNITLHIRQLTFRGTIEGAKMSGSVTVRGSIYTFSAQQGTPGSGRP